MISELGIDIETYSSVSIQNCGVYKYTEAEDFAILLFAYSVDNGHVQIVDLASGEELPKEIRDALTDERVMKTAYNASFERVCLSRFLGLPLNEFLDPSQWQCTMVAGARMGLPLSLEQCGTVLGLDDEGKGKMREGKALIRYFSCPDKSGKRHMPSDAPEKWETFKRYCVRDVEVEQAILKKVRRLPVPEFERINYIIDQHINDRGILIDKNFVENAARFDSEYKDGLLVQAKKETGLDNPNSPSQIKEYLHRITGLNVESLSKADLDTLDEKLRYWPTAQRVIALRREMGKTSNKKYIAMQNYMCKDGRARGLFQFYGAARTGRFAGRGIQLQNLPQNHINDLEYARNLVLNGDLFEFEQSYDRPTNILSELIRTALVAKDGCTFHVCDFSAIEARVVAWLAGENWVLDVFRKGGDIYCEMASRMFKVPVQKHGINAELRPKGKVGILACIAGSELITTDKGLVPIKDVTTDMKVWDGENFVEHDGVSFRGYRRVKEYEGLRATFDHNVYVNSSKDVTVLFNEAIKLGLHLTVTDDSVKYERKPLSKSGSCCRVYDIINAGPNHRYTASGKLVHNCGYGGGVNAFEAMGGSKLGMTEDEEKRCVDLWRKENPNIVRLWSTIENTAIKSIQTKETFTINRGMEISFKWGALLIKLPSGRYLCYPRARVEREETSWGRVKFGISYEGVNQTTRKWERVRTFSGKLVENCVQAIARDILCIILQRAEREGMNVVAHVHDEIIVEESRDGHSLDEVAALFCEPIPWAIDLPLRGDGYTTPFYKKD